MAERKKLSDVMNARKFVFLPPEATAAVAAKKMLERQIGAIHRRHFPRARLGRACGLERYLAGEKLYHDYRFSLCKPLG